MWYAAYYFPHSSCFAALDHAHELWQNVSSMWVRLCPVCRIGDNIAYHLKRHSVSSPVLSPELHIWAAGCPSVHPCISCPPPPPAYMTLTVNDGVSCHPTVCSHPAWYCNNRKQYHWVDNMVGGRVPERCRRRRGGGEGGGMGRCLLRQRCHR